MILILFVKSRNCFSGFEEWFINFKYLELGIYVLIFVLIKIGLGFFLVCCNF